MEKLFDVTMELALNELANGTSYLSKFKMIYSLTNAIKEIDKGISYLSAYKGNSLMIQKLKEVENGMSYLSKYKNPNLNSNLNSNLNPKSKNKLNKKLKDKDYITFGILIEQVFDNLSMKSVFQYWHNYCLQVGSIDKIKMTEWIKYTKQTYEIIY